MKSRKVLCRGSAWRGAGSRLLAPSFVVIEQLKQSPDGLFLGEFLRVVRLVVLDRFDALGAVDDRDLELPIPQKCRHRAFLFFGVREDAMTFLVVAAVTSFSHVLAHRRLVESTAFRILTSKERDQIGDERRTPVPGNKASRAGATVSHLAAREQVTRIVAVGLGAYVLELRRPVFLRAKLVEAVSVVGACHGVGLLIDVAGSDKEMVNSRATNQVVRV